MVDYSIRRFGEALSADRYSIDLENKTFISDYSDLVLDFTDSQDWTFKTGSYCTFRTLSNCTFNTGYGCIFNTHWRCTFKTGHSCTFNTGDKCTFNTCHHCIFSIYDINSCTFKSYDDTCIVLDRGSGKRYVLTKEFMQLQKVTNG